MLNFKLLVVSLIFLAACAPEEGRQGPRGPGVEVQPMTDVEAIVESENEYRVSFGQLPLSRGLVCTLYTVPNGSTGITGAALTKVASFTHLGNFNQANSSANDGLNILPSPLRTTHKQWFVVRCTGKLVIVETGYYQFDLASDDGSMLYVGGTNIINNDGNHGVTLKSGVKHLREGVVDFRLDYMQGPGGSQALILSSGGSLVPAENFYR